MSDIVDEFFLALIERDANPEPVLEPQTFEDVKWNMRAARDQGMGQR